MKRRYFNYLYINFKRFLERNFNLSVNGEGKAEKRGNEASSHFKITVEKNSGIRLWKPLFSPAQIQVCKIGHWWNCRRSFPQLILNLFHSKKRAKSLVFQKVYTISLQSCKLLKVIFSYCNTLSLMLRICPEVNTLNAQE